jgi:two-component system, OmpR family, alkaline phosphatase synthesis response regulator PhoP
MGRLFNNRPAYGVKQIIMAHEKILIVEDEQDIIELLTYNLEQEGYQALYCNSGEDAFTLVYQKKPHLILLDLMLPGVSGLDVCRNLKQNDETRDIPIIMLTAKSEDSDIITGLEMGADDYLTKPFSPKILVARIRSVLRRNKQETKKPEPKKIKIHDIFIDISKHQVLAGGKPVDLSATEFSILVFLAQNPGWVFSRNQIIGAVKGEDYPVTERSVDVQILGLRKKLGEMGKHIQTVRGVGYRLQLE